MVDEDGCFDIEALETIREILGDEMEELKFLEAVKTLSNLKYESKREAKDDAKRTDLLAAFVPKKKRGSVGTSHSHLNQVSSPRKYIEEHQNQNKEKKEKKNSRRKRSFEGDQEHIQSAKKAKKATKKPKLGPPPPIPGELKAKIERKGGEEIKLVIFKQVYKTDLNKSEDRLSMPEKQASKFLKEGEEDKLKEGMAVKVMEPCGHESDMKLRRWNYMHSSRSFVLTTSWIELLKRNQHLNIFKVGNLIQVWSFRISGFLWFAIDKVANENGDGDEGEAIPSPTSSEVLI